MTTHVFFHRDLDGYACGYISHEAKFDINAIYHTVNYNEALDFREIADGDTVFFFDFTPEVDEVKILMNYATLKNLVILDHHNVEDKHEALSQLAQLWHWPVTLGLNKNAKGCVEVVMEYTWKRGLSMDDIFVLERIGNRDVWDFSLPMTKEVHEAICLMCPFPADDSGIMGWFNTFSSAIDGDNLLSIGELLLKKSEAEVKRIAANAKEVYFEKLGKTIPFVVSNTLISEVGNVLALGSNEKLACVGNFSAGKLLFSFRSVNETALDAARTYGGGGHHNAAGATITELPVEILQQIVGR
jgi:oligoribonuclease NrnB/cAMP/cGMP phosphodiesterase (DHH superfamily)